MRVVTGSEMQLIDKKAIQNYRIPRLQLMENAGTKVYEEIVKAFPDVITKVVGIFCGKGNNGGDGFVVARLLAKKNTKVKVILFGKRTELTGEARINFQKITKEGLEIHEVNSLKDMESLEQKIKNIDFAVDALLGTGFKGAVSGLLGKLIDHINKSAKPVVSIDMPSGVNADTGEVLGSCIRATLTVTLGLPKMGIIMHPGVVYAGKVIVANIGFPNELIEASDGTSIELLDHSIVRKILPKREPTVHKGNVGKVLIIGGSVGYTGAVSLASLACLRGGAGLVTLGIPTSLNNILEMKLTEVITLPLPETKNKSLALTGEKVILEAAKGYQAVAIGPGVGRERESWQLVRKLITHVNCPLVIDADALNAVAGQIDCLSHAKNPSHVIVTPHAGEMARLINSTPEAIQTRRIDIARGFSQKQKVITVLKGANTVISSGAKSTAINTTGNAGMASAGMGDVLTGVIAALVAQGLSSFNAACAGAYIHGLAGDLAKDEKGEMGLIATDVLEKVPFAIKSILSL